MSEQSPSRFLDKIIIRLPDGLRDRIRRAATLKGRSVNAELLVLLENTYPPETRLDEYIADIANIIRTFPEDQRDRVWQIVFNKLSIARAAGNAVESLGSNTNRDEIG